MKNFIIFPHWPCYSGTFQKVSFFNFQFTLYMIFFSGQHFFLNAIFRVEVCWFPKNICPYITKKTCIKSLCLLTARGRGVKASGNCPRPLRMQVFLLRAP